MQFCVVRNEEKEKRSIFEGLTPPPIMVLPRNSQGSQRPHLAVHVSKVKSKNDDSSLTCDDTVEISVDSLDDDKDMSLVTSLQSQNIVKNSKVGKSPQKKTKTVKFIKKKLSNCRKSNPDISDLTAFSDENDHHMDDAKQAKRVRSTSPNGNNEKRFNEEYSSDDSSRQSDVDNDFIPTIKHSQRNIETTGAKCVTRGKSKLEKDFCNEYSSDQCDASEAHNSVPPLHTGAKRMHVTRTATSVSSRKKIKDKFNRKKHVNFCRHHEESSDVSSLATSDSYIPPLLGVGAPSQEQLPLSYHIYSTGKGVVDDVILSSPDLSTVESSSPIHNERFENKEVQAVLAIPSCKKEESLPLKSNNNLLLEPKDSSSDSDSSSYDGNIRQISRRIASVQQGRRSFIRAEVNRRFRRHGLRFYVSLFYKWKRHTQNKLLLCRVFSHSMVLWENRYQRRYSSIPFHLLRHIMNIWKFAVTLTRQKRQELHQEQKALMFRGISLISKVFVQWKVWTRESLKKNKQLAHLQHMTKQVCFLGLVMLYQKLLVRYDKARDYHKRQRQCRAFRHLFDFAAMTQERHHELQAAVNFVRMRRKWQCWTNEHKRVLVERNCSIHSCRRNLVMQENWWHMWQRNFDTAKRTRLFAQRLEEIYFNKKLQVSLRCCIVTEKYMTVFM